MLLHDELPHTGQSAGCHADVRATCDVPVCPRRVLFSHQVAVLCQFLREVDYMTAFKALQEQNRYGVAGQTLTSSSC